MLYIFKGMSTHPQDYKCMSTHLQDYKCVLIYGTSQSGRTTIATALLQNIRPDMLITDIPGISEISETCQLIKLSTWSYKDLRKMAYSVRQQKKSCYILIRQGTSDFLEIQALLMTYRHLGISGVIYISHDYPPPQMRPCFTHVVVMNVINVSEFKKIAQHYNAAVPSDTLESRIVRHAGCIFPTQNGITVPIRIQM